MKNNKAFTLIELLVVIAIVGFLTAIIFANLTNAREKSQNAAVQVTLSSLRSQADLYLSSSGGSYSGLCDDLEIQKMIDSITETNGEDTNCVVSPSGDSYTISAGEAGTISPESYCVDSSGFSGETSISQDDQTTAGTCLSKEGSGGGTASGGETASTESCFGFSAGTITSYDHATCGTDIVIPSTIGGDAVTSIGQSVFSFMQITSITIPDSVTTIGNSAFFPSSLPSATIPDSVTSIEPYAFFATSLSSVTIPDSVTSIREGVFGDTLLTSVTIPNSVTSIDSHAFNYSQLTSITIPDSVTSIDSHAFNNTPLTSASLKTGTTYQSNSFPASCTEGNGCIVFRP